MKTSGDVTWCICGEVSAMFVLGPLGLCPEKVGSDIVKEAGVWKGLRITVKQTIQNIQTQNELVTSASALIIVFKEPPRDRKKQKI